MEHMGHLSAVPQVQQVEEAQQAHVHSYYPPVPLDTTGVQPILINEARNLLSKGNNVGLRTWEAALHLAWQLFSQCPGLVRNKRVLELGAGTGLLSLLCAGHLQAAHVMATDGLCHVCESLQANINLNKANFTLSGGALPEVLQLDWTDRPAIKDLVQSCKESSRQFDLVIGADITYHPDILRPLAELLDSLKNSFPDMVILISATIRSNTFSKFAAICRDEFKFKVTELQVNIPSGLRYSGFFYSLATPIKIISLTR